MYLLIDKRKNHYREDFLLLVFHLTVKYFNGGTSHLLRQKKKSLLFTALNLGIEKFITIILFDGIFDDKGLEQG